MLVVNVRKTEIHSHWSCGLIINVYHLHFITYTIAKRIQNTAYVACSSSFMDIILYVYHEAICLDIQHKLAHS